MQGLLQGRRGQCSDAVREDEGQEIQGFGAPGAQCGPRQPAVLAVLVMAWGSTAMAAPVGRQFHPATSSATWPAVSSEGHPGAPSSRWTSPRRLSGPTFLTPANWRPPSTTSSSRCTPATSTPATATPLHMPATAATLVTAQATSDRHPATSELRRRRQWYFPVAANLTTATLQVASFSKVLGNEAGDFINWTFSSDTHRLRGPRAVATCSRSGQGAAGNVAGRANGSEAAGWTQGGGVPVGAVIGGTLGGIAILGAGSAAAVSVARRRAFYRADREGRVVLTGPPPLIAGAAVARVPAFHRRGHAIVVKLLGWLEVEGTKKPITAGPLLELITFLALNPGRSFTSVQIRESIWGLGRRPITSATFRKYMVEFRKAFGHRRCRHRPSPLRDDRQRHLRLGPVPSGPHG